MRTHGLVIALFAAAALAPAAADAQDPTRVYSVTVSRGRLGFYSEALPGNRQRRPGLERILRDHLPIIPYSDARGQVAPMLLPPQFSFHH